jgi:hypothetical protein
MAALGGLARETRQEPATHSPRPGRGAMDWGDVRVFLAVAREGSMRAAGRALRLSQPTIARRLSRVRDQFWRTDFVRPPARGVAPQRRRRAAGRGGRGCRRGGAEVGAPACGGLAGAERYSAGIDR